MERTGRLAWIDASAGVAGDMLLGALLDAGAPLAACQEAIDAVVPATVRLRPEPVTRCGLRATGAHVDLLMPDQPHRAWSTIRDLLLGAALPDGVRSRALAVLTALASAEARVHGVAQDEVHFHEVGSWDSIADVVGACAALDALAIDVVVLGGLALGSGIVRTQHGMLPVPVPAVLDLCRGWAVTGGGPDGVGELSTPTGVALVTTLASRQGPLPAMTPESVGLGAGSRERADRPNVVRVVLGRAPTGSVLRGSRSRGGGSAAGAAAEANADVAADASTDAATDASTDAELEQLVLLATTVDDLDPRVWPSVVEDLLGAGAADAWLTPVLMKKGRPGHVLSVLAAPEAAAALRSLVLHATSALGVRQSTVRREVLDRAWVDVPVAGTTLPVKVGHRGGVVVHATAEFDDAARLASARGRPVREMLDAAAASAAGAGVVPGSRLPDGARPAR